MSASRFDAIIEYARDIDPLSRVAVDVFTQTPHLAETLQILRESFPLLGHDDNLAIFSGDASGNETPNHFECVSDWSFGFPI